MQYLLLIYDNEEERAQRAAADPEGQAAFMEDYRSFTAGIIAEGAFKAGDALHPVSTATSVRVREGKPLVTDGPFAETREQLGGYYLVDARDLDHAIEIAQRIPTAKTGTIEVRPLMVWEQED
jgi:hypothetical protein